MIYLRVFIQIAQNCLKSVFRIRMFYFSLISATRIRFMKRGSDPKTDAGSKKSAKIMENIHKNQPQSQ